MTDGIPGGRSTYGVCYGALAWLVEDGHVGEVDVTGLKVALTVMYDDDELGSPWTVVLHVDADGSERQREVLADVFLGNLGGPHVGLLPWVRKARHLVDVRVDSIQLTPDGEGYKLARGHVVQLELLGQDPDYIRKSNGKFSVTVSKVTVSLPTRERKPA